MKIVVKKKNIEKRLLPAGVGRDEGGTEQPAEDARREAPADGGAYFSLFDNLYYAVLLVDREDRICEGNRRAEEFFASDRRQLKGLSISELVFGMSARMMIKIRENIARGRYTVLNGTCIRRTGGNFAAEIALSGMRRDGADLVVFSIRNHSRLDGIQTQLRTEHNALQNAASAIVIADSDGSFQFVNKAFVDMWKFSGDAEAMGAKLEQLWMEPELARALIESPLSGTGWSGEMLAVKKDGTPFWVQAMSAANRDEAKQVIGMVFSFVDVSERYKAEESIRKEVEGQMDQAKARDEFSGLLNIIRIEDIFQLIDSTRKSGALTIRSADGRAQGRVCFADGRVVSAESDQRKDMDAIVDLLRDGGHGFEFKRGEGDEYPERMSDSTTSVLLEASRLIDEDEPSHPERDN